MKLFVLGATGATGKLFVEQAVAAGHTVTAFVRNPQGMPGATPAVTVVPGRVDDVDGLAAALAGHDAIVSTLGNGRGGRYKTLILDSTTALIEAAERAGVKRAVVLSAFGVGESLPKASLTAKLVYRTMLAQVFTDKARGEALLSSSDLKWTLAYPVTLSDKPMGGFLASVLSETPKVRGIPKIPRADVAAFLLEAAERNDYMRETVVLRPARTPTRSPHPAATSPTTTAEPAQTESTI